MPRQDNATAARKARLIPLNQLTRPRLQKWLDAQPPRKLVVPSSHCACIIAQHMQCRMASYRVMYRNLEQAAAPEWAVEFQRRAVAVSQGTRFLNCQPAITWAHAARILREMP